MIIVSIILISTEDSGAILISFLHFSPSNILSIILISTEDRGAIRIH